MASSATNATDKQLQTVVPAPADVLIFLKLANRFESICRQQCDLFLPIVKEKLCCKDFQKSINFRCIYPFFGKVTAYIGHRAGYRSGRLLDGAFVFASQCLLQRIQISIIQQGTVVQLPVQRDMRCRTRYLPSVKP